MLDDSEGVAPKREADGESVFMVDVGPAAAGLLGCRALSHEYISKAANQTAAAAVWNVLKDFPFSSFGRRGNDSSPTLSGSLF